MPRALIVDDDESVLFCLASLLEEEGFDAVTAPGFERAREEIHRSPPDAAFLDLMLPDGNGLDLLVDLTAARQPHVLLMTGVEELAGALSTLSFRSLQYMRKPLDLEQLAQHARKIRRQLQAGRRGPLGPGEEHPTIVGKSAAIRQVLATIDRVATTDATVLIQGESGTGKELVAAAIHLLSPRAAGPWFALNCGAVPDGLVDSELFGHEQGAFTGAGKARRGLFEETAGGTLFLDEITEMPPELQVRLLRVLEEGAMRRVGGSVELPVDVRVVAATNRDPQQAIRDGVLREDLYYRLAAFPLPVPPLRERGEDVEVLAEHFLGIENRKTGAAKRFGPEVVDRLYDYHWPGNVRQLRHIVSRAFILADEEIRAEHLPEAITGDRRADPAADLWVKAGTSLEEMERRLIRATLARFGGNKTKAAAALGVSVRTLYNRLKAWRDDGPTGPD